MTTTFKIPHDWFVCPETKKSMIDKSTQLISDSGHYNYNTEHNYWNFIPAELKLFDKKLWAAWDVLQSNAMIPYEIEPEKNLGVGPRKDFLQFAEFCNFNGLVLDVGVGPQLSPTHIQYNTKKDVTFIGLDPILGKQPRDFTFVQGLGEYLPFKDNLFDQVLFVTSLDHFIDPVIALNEAKRVIKPNGSVCVWLGEKDKNAPKPSVSPDWYKALQIPEGAEDPFHYRRFSVEDFKQFLKKTELKITDEKIHVVDQWRKNCFYKLMK